MKMRKLEECPYLLILNVALPLVDPLFMSLSKLQTKWSFLPSLRFKKHLLTMGQKRNNINKCADKHKFFETIPWYLCQKLDMLGCRCGHLITLVHHNDSSTIAIVVGGVGGEGLLCVWVIAH
jgi:hypothetical protein